MGNVLGEARAKREYFGQQPFYDIGLYFSSRTCDWVGRETPATYFHSFQVAHQACAMEHLQFGVLLDENVSLEALKKFPVICLSNVAILSAREAESPRKYVRYGGELHIAGQTGQLDARGALLT